MNCWRARIIASPRQPDSVSDGATQYDIPMAKEPDKQPDAPQRTFTYRSIALPTEHGGWGFTLEPIILGLLVAPSAAAWELSVAAIAIFLGRRPFKIVSTDLVRRRWLPRTSIAAVFAAFYGALGLAGVIGAMVTTEAPFWPAFAVAAPLAAIALYGDAHSRSRTLVAELAGSAAMGSTVTAIALADGWDALPAFGLWIVLVTRGVAAIALVRGQIRRVHGRPVLQARVYGAQAFAVTAVTVAAVTDAAPWLAVVAIAGIAGLAYVSLQRPPVQARVVGWTQIVVGLVVVILTALGSRLDW